MKRFWISYTCFTVALPFLFVQVHHDGGLIVATYFLALFTTTGLFCGVLRVKFAVKLLPIALIASTVAWLFLPAKETYVNPSDCLTEFAILFSLLTILMIIGCLVRSAAKTSKHQSLLGFIAAVLASAMISGVSFVSAVLPKSALSSEKESKIRTAKPSGHSDFDFNHPLGSAYPTTTNVYTMTTNALAVPDLKLQK